MANAFQWSKPVSTFPIGGFCKVSECEFDAQIIAKFLKAVSYDINTPFRPKNEVLENEIRRLFEAENLEEPYKRRIMRTIGIGVASADLYYPDQPFEVQVYVARYTCLLVYVDDAVDQNFLPELDVFMAKLLSGGTFEDPNLAHLVRLLTRETPKFFGPYGTGAIFTSTLGFMNACLVEHTYPHGLSVPPSSARFPRFLRVKGGTSEAYAQFMFPTALFPEAEFLEKYLPTIPDLINLIDFVNDILSFYKEAVVGTEENVYFVNAARLYSCSPMKIVLETCDGLASLQEQIQATLKGNDERLATTETNFLKGFVMWHLSQKRYRLGELGLPVGNN